MDEDELMTVTELATLIRKRPADIYQMNHRRTGPRYLRVGKTILYRRTDVRAWLDTRYVSQGAA